MKWNPRQTLDDFRRAAKLAGVELAVGDVCIQESGDPHETDLPRHCGGVYVFTCKRSGKALKVGKAGPNSNPRFRHQHYKAKGAKNTLAVSLLSLKKSGCRESDLPKCAWVDCLQEDGTLDATIKAETCRRNFFVYFRCEKPQGKKTCTGGGKCETCRKAGFILNFLEAFLQLKLQPFFEGRNYDGKR